MGIGITIIIIIAGLTIWAMSENSQKANTNSGPYSQSYTGSVALKRSMRSSETKGLLNHLGSEYDEIKSNLRVEYGDDINKVIKDHTDMCLEYEQNMDHWFYNDRNKYVMALVLICGIEDEYGDQLDEMEMKMKRNINKFKN